MQLKRDTDYALRILFHIGEQCAGKNEASEGLSLLDISSRTGVPRISALRICGYFAAENILLAAKTKSNETRYFPGPLLYRQSLLNIIRVTESSADLFAVFERGSRLYKMRGPRLQAAQAEIERTLSAITVGDLLAKKERT